MAGVSALSWPVVESTASWLTVLELRLTTYRRVPAALSTMPYGLVPTVIVAGDSGVSVPSAPIAYWLTVPPP